MGVDSDSTRRDGPPVEMRELKRKQERLAGTEHELKLELARLHKATRNVCEMVRSFRPLLAQSDGLENESILHSIGLDKLVPDREPKPVAPQGRTCVHCCCLAHIASTVVEASELVGGRWCTMPLLLFHWPSASHPRAGRTLAAGRP